MPKFQGRTVAAARLAAAKALGQPEERLVVKVLDPGRRGFFGLGFRPAVIEVSDRPRLQPEAGETSGATSGKLTLGAPTAQVPQQAEPVQGAVPAGPEAPEGPSPAVQAARHEKNLAHLQEQLPGLIDYLNGVYRALGVAAVAKVTTARIHAVTVELETASPGRVIGHHGRRINAVEELGTAWLTYHGVTDPGLVLDLAGYRKRRQETVADIAADTAMEVVATGRAVFLDPMPARERRELHQLLAKNGKVRTYSRGREPFRAVVVAPK